MTVIDKTAQLHTPLVGTDQVLDVTGNTALTYQQSGSTVLLDHAAGATVTLPKPAAGLRFKFIVRTTVTSNSYKVITDASTTFLQGYLNVPVAAGTSTAFFADGTTHRSINLNGGTQGGLLGGQFELVCIDGTHWQVAGTCEGSGTVATPFATS